MISALNRISRVTFPLPTVGAVLLAILVAGTDAQDVGFSVDASRVLHRVSPYLAGGSLKDVNHEVYGGILSLMIFGESFQEPAHSPPQSFRIL